MSSDDRGMVFTAVALLAFILIISVGFILGAQCLNITLQPTVSVTVDGEVVFEGSAAGVVIESSGATTKVQTGKGFLYLLPKAKYVSSDVHIEPLKEKSQ